MLIAITIVQLLAALVLILIVLFQSGKSKGLSGAIGGIAGFQNAKIRVFCLIYNILYAVSILIHTFCSKCHLFFLTYSL